jgi:hypothetical protein
MQVRAGPATRRGVHPSPPPTGSTSVAGGVEAHRCVCRILFAARRLWRAVVAWPEGAHPRACTTWWSRGWHVCEGPAPDALRLRTEARGARRAGLAFKGSAFGASEAQQTLDVNFHGTRRVTEALLPLVPEGGAVVNVCRWHPVLPPRAPAPAALVRHGRWLCACWRRADFQQIMGKGVVTSGRRTHRAALPLFQHNLHHGVRGARRRHFVTETTSVVCDCVLAPKFARPLGGYPWGVPQPTALPEQSG